MVTKQDIIDYYEQCEIDYRLVWGLKKSMAMHYGYWDKTTRTFRQALDRTNEVLAKRVKIKKTDRILDAGCGVGGSSIYLSKKYGCKVVGITIVGKQVKTAEQNAKKHGVDRLATFKKRDYARTGFPRGSFDAVLGIESVGHAADKKAFLKEAYRLLRKKGRLGIIDSFVTEKKLPDEETRLIQKLAKAWVAPSLLKTKSFRQDMKTAGFKKIQIRDKTSHIMPLALRMYAAFFPGFVVSKIIEIFKPRTQTQKNNLWSAYYQYPIYKNRLLKYCIVTAEK